MRKWNAPAGALLIILAVIHGAAGAFELFGVTGGGAQWFSVLSWLFLAVLVFHAAAGIMLTIDSIRIGRKSGAFYGKANIGFWTKRISGFAIILLIFSHLLVFIGQGGGSFRLTLFEGPQLILSLLLAAATALHLLMNLRPLLIAAGASGYRKYLADLLFVLAVVLAVCGIAFVIYYFRWNVWWKWSRS